MLVDSGQYVLTKITNLFCVPLFERSMSSEPPAFESRSITRNHHEWVTSAPPFHIVQVPENGSCDANSLVLVSTGWKRQSPLFDSLEESHRYHLMTYSQGEVLFASPKFHVHEVKVDSSVRFFLSQHHLLPSPSHTWQRSFHNFIVRAVHALLATLFWHPFHSTY